MGKVISAKLTGQHSELLAWMEQQAEAPNALILLALYTLKDMREGRYLPADGLIIEADAEPLTGLPVPAELPIIEEAEPARLISLDDLIVALQAVAPTFGDEIVKRLEPVLRKTEVSVNLNTPPVIQVPAVDVGESPAGPVHRAKRPRPHSNGNGRHAPPTEADDGAALDAATNAFLGQFG